MSIDTEHNSRLMTCVIKSEILTLRIHFPESTTLQDCAFFILNSTEHSQFIMKAIKGSENFPELLSLFNLHLFIF